MDNTSSPAEQLVPTARRSRFAILVLVGAVLVLGLMFVRKARDNRSSFDKLRDDWSQAEDIFNNALVGAKTVDARRKIATEERPDAAAFAERCLVVARSQPDTPAGLAALCWAVINAPESAPGKEALGVLKGGRLDHADPEDLSKALDSARTSSQPPEVGPCPLAPLVLDVTKRNLDHRRAARLLTWVCARQFNDQSAEEPPSFAEAADLIAGRFAESPDISHFGESLGGAGNGSPPWAGKYEKHLRTIVEKNPTRLVRCTASYALASVIQATGENRQDEAETLYRQFVKDFDASDPSIKLVEDSLIHDAKIEAENIRTHGIGKPAPAINGTDLDGRPISLADFRGKVVMISFWATWCGPCMKLIPHERALLGRLKDKPFAIVGINGDREPEELRKALAKTEIPWRSFQDERPGEKQISREWQVSGWPTLYLIDHEGIIRKRWVGAPDQEVLDTEIKQLVQAATQTR